MEQEDDKASGPNGSMPESPAPNPSNAPQDPTGADIQASDASRSGSRFAAPGAEREADPSPSARAEIEAREAELRRFEDLYLRERAELENFKRRAQRERTEILRFAVEPIARDLLSVVDNLERAIEHTAGSDPALTEGVKLVHKALLDVLERHGIQRIQAAGTSFDPSLHEAIAQVESADHEPNQVVSQLQAGYKLHERLLRPAMVAVCGRKAAPSVETASDRD